MRAAVLFCLAVTACPSGQVTSSGESGAETQAATTQATQDPPTTEESGAATTAAPTGAPGNLPPLAKIADDLTTDQAAPLRVKFTSISSDPDGSIVKTQWDFGDGAQAEGEQAEHVFQDEGSFEVTLTVTDDDGASDQISTSIKPGGCPTFKPPAWQGDLTASELSEASGLAPSRRSPGVVWTHNDSGASVLLTSDLKGEPLGVYTLQGAALRDWEDMALGPGPVADKQYLYIGDIGDNNKDRNSVKVYRAPEPPVDVNQANVMAAIGGVETLSFTYPGGARDSESLLVDPVSGDLFLVTKVVGASAEVFRAAAPVQSGALEHVADADLGAMGLATGGSVSAAGDWVVVRSYFSARMWSRPQGMPLAQAFMSTPCTVPLAMEIQGEAIAFAAEGQAYYTVSEGETPPLFAFDVP